MLALFFISHSADEGCPDAAWEFKAGCRVLDVTDEFRIARFSASAFLVASARAGKFAAM